MIGEGLGTDARLGTNVSNCLMVGFLSTKPTLTVTGSQNNYNQGVLDKTGKVGIGDVTPTAKLHIVSDAGEDAGLILEPKQPGTDNTFVQLRDGSHRISVDSDGEMSLVSDSAPLSLEGASITLRGKVGINTTSTVTGYSLSVDGGIITDEVLIRNVEDWPDYVFCEDHILMPLGELRHYYNENHHLPEIPSTQEVEEQGIDVADMQKLLLKKIEELTLYTVEQQRLIEELQAKIDRLENQ